jgi:hypothetical protein
VGTLADAQAKMNRTTAGQWGLYRRHREAIERLLAPRDAAEKGRSLCVVGAGNCNDLDLKWLTQVFAEVHLVDIDREAIEGATRRQGVDGITLGAPLDLTGVAEVVSSWEVRPPADAEVVRMARASDETPMPQLGRRFDVVLSPCVLTQLLNPLRRTLGRGHRLFDEALHAMRRRHLRLMSTLLSNGGRGVVLIDLISSEAYDELAHVPEEQLPALVDKFVDRRKSFVGLDPESILRAIDEDSMLREVAGDVRMSRPWLWHLSLRRSFVVYAVELTRRRVANDSARSDGSIVVT